MRKIDLTMFDFTGKDIKMMPIYGTKEPVIDLANNEMVCGE